MHENFARNLSLMRREKNVSQRAAAAELGISQALLSHYEKGAREPGLSFVTRACDYYGVSADFLLGRTMLRDGAQPDPETMHDASGDRDNRLSGSISAVLHKKLIINSVSLLFDVLGRSGGKAAVETAAAYLGDAVYKLFRHLYTVAGEHDEAFFSIPPEAFSLLADADMAFLEARLFSLLRGKGAPRLPALSHDSLFEMYPQLAQSLLMLSQQAGARMEKLR